MGVTFGEEMAEEDTVTVEPKREKFLAPTSPTDSGPSLLDELVDAVKLTVDNRIRLAVDPTVRPGGWVLEFEAVLSMADIRRYQRAATNNGQKKPEDADMIKANGMPLVERNTGIFKGNQQVFDEDGEPLKLTSTVWLEKVCGQNERNYDTLAGLKKFLGDALVLQMGVALLKAAGYGAEMEPLDPTFG